MTQIALYAAFFFSGASALLFQTLWFRQVGLALGNSVWASSLVLASFMAGLGLGSVLASRRREEGPAALRLYAALEVSIGLSGVGLAFLLPHLPEMLVPLFAPLRDNPIPLNGVRVLVAFFLLLLPTTAMGATLPVLVAPLSRREGFGPALGRLYAWNTLGAVAGALVGELVLVERLGLRGTGIAAAALNFGAAGVVVALVRRLPAEVASPSRAVAAGGGAARVLAAAAVCGFVLLALEVVWFRILQLFVVGTSLTFSLLLVVVLLGIAGGALAGSAWLRVSADAPRWVVVVALGAGAATVLGYRALDAWLSLTGIPVAITAGPSLVMAATLMLSTSLASGLLFTQLGTILQRSLGGEARSAGLLTLANTTGAMAGALAAGFLLLPGLGSELSLFLLSLAYGLVALLVHHTAVERTRRERVVLLVAAATWAVLLAFYPFGLMERSYLVRVAGRFAAYGSRTIAFKEGLADSLLYMRKEIAGEPLSFRLVTNAVPMSDTGFAAERYMKTFVYWALAVRPQSRRALLISYGLGSTAAALTETPGLESIDVVDISPDVLRMGRIAFPAPASYPLDDPRVRTHVEDGRFFLLTSPGRYDLITAEPPPPRAAGVVNLYSQEYFGLVRDRLVEGGVVTYWLPVFDLDVASMRSIVKGFCNAFPDCSLWTGCGFHWMLAGTRGLREPLDEAGFRRQWGDPAVAPTLAAVALETPEHLGALFLADGDGLRELAGDAPPLVDNFPLRLARSGPRADSLPFYVAFMDAARSRARFERSRWIRELWPQALREATLARFAEQDLFNRDPNIIPGLQAPERFPILHAALTRTSSRVVPLLLAGSDPREQQAVDRAAAKGVSGPVIDLALGLRALSARDYDEVERRLVRVAEAEPAFVEIPRFRALALCLAGRGADAAALLTNLEAEPTASAVERRFWADLRKECPAAGRGDAERSRRSVSGTPPGL